MIIRGERFACPVPVTTWLDGAARLPAKGRRDTAVSVVLHETCTRSVADTVRTLQNRGLGCHLIVGPGGEVSQHADLATEVTWHAGAHNGPAVGIEVVNPYYPTSVKAGDPWGRRIAAAWAHRGEYVLPTLASAEAVVSLLRFLTLSDELAVPRRWPSMLGAAAHFQPVSTCAKPTQGIYAHQHCGAHADGAWLVLYAWLRIEAGLSPELAFEEAARRAEGKRWTASLADLEVAPRTVELPPMPWTQEDERQLEDLCPGTYAAMVSEAVCR